MVKILIADDNEALRELYALEFEGEGYEVITAANGDEAVAQCREQKPDAIVLDIGMPEKSGLEVLGELSLMNGGTPVIVNTAYPMFKMDYRAHRASGWVTKSSNPDGIIDAVNKALAQKDNSTKRGG
jgi:CheY-like chemotaxis protein